MKQEMELAMKLLEKDIHEKQVSKGLHLFLADAPRLRVLITAQCKMSS